MEFDCIGSSSLPFYLHQKKREGKSYADFIRLHGLSASAIGVFFTIDKYVKQRNEKIDHVNKPM